MAMTAKTHTGLDFQDLAKGGERNYSCSYLVNLDPDLMFLTNTGANFLDQARNVVAGHTSRVIDQIVQRSGRAVDQFCFGSTYLQLNPNYRRLERMDPLTWKKEGVSSAWSGARGLRKSCCKVCCQEKLCSGCSRMDCDCKNGPVRGNYDGLVVLACITKETSPKSGPGKIDHEDLSLILEYSLTVHFMQSPDPALSKTIVHTGRDIFLQEHNPKLGKAKKHPAYCVFVSYRLVKGSDSQSDVATVPGTPLSLTQLHLNDEDDLEVVEELEDKQLTNRLETLEQENRSLKEEVARLDHGRSWLEERVDVLENIMRNRNNVNVGVSNNNSNNQTPSLQTV